MPETLSFQVADDRFQLGAILSAYDESRDVVVLPPGRLDATAVELDLHSYVVDGDLELQGTLRCWEEGGFLVVRGNLAVDNLLISGPIIHVAGALTVSNAIHTDYNHGELHVLGDVRAAIIAAEHLFQIGGRLECPATIDFGGLRVADPSFVPTLTRQQAARESRTYFVDEALNEEGYVDGATLAELLASGVHPLK